MSRFARTSVALLALILCGADVRASVCGNTSVGITPLTDLGTGTYKGLAGGLYLGGSNSMPATHRAAGVTQAKLVRPMDSTGRPDSNGRFALLSIGMSNTTQEFTAFMNLATTDSLRHPQLVLVDGAQSSQTSDIIANPNSTYWTVVQERLSASGVTPAQVAAAWVKTANRNLGRTPDATRLSLQADIVKIARNLKAKFPNLSVAYFSSRIYGGYAERLDVSPEPYAFETGLAVRDVIAIQLSGDPSLNFDSGKGAVTAPWMAWGPYMWADGIVPRSDGLTWPCSDFQGDGQHPGPSGEAKVANMLLRFFQEDPTAQLWYLANPPEPGLAVPRPPTNLQVR